MSLRPLSLGLATLCLVLAPLSAQADCPTAEATVFSCQIGKKTLTLCHWKGALTYSYGVAGKPDLTIAEPLESVAYTPWPGIGSSIWETVAFQNQGYIYEVWTSIERDPDSTQPLQGGVNVLKGEALQAQLTCDTGTASNPLDGIYALKESIGQCWDFDSRSWQGSCN
ncbi:hypothetical protein [Neotabrizicola sp. sgz301269]|uniref:hypothetical protein n=1 Tax=Neotabrizicola sp. sgz301269 TaxID=3276282 RepID=UPI00376FCC44